MTDTQNDVHSLSDRLKANQEKRVTLSILEKSSITQFSLNSPIPACFIFEINHLKPDDNYMTHLQYN
jgi:hypothetical protein